MNVQIPFPLIFSTFIMTICAGFIALFGCSSTKRTESIKVITNGPLTIQWEVRETTSNVWFDLSGKSRRKYATSYFSIKHLNKPVTFLTNKEEVAYFNQALFLKDAPKPAILAGTHKMYLISDDNGKADVKLLDAEGGDFGKFQWLDSENGQPGEQEKIYQIDNSKSSRFLTGGRFLMVNTRMLLDVQTLETYPIDNNSSALINQLQGYNAFQSEVICMSPGKTQIVLKAFRRNVETNLPEYALVAVDFRTNLAYAVPFDRTDTRLVAVQDANFKWVSTFFDWTTDQYGNELLSRHLFEKLPYWKGKFNLHLKTDKPAQYCLMPVLPAMTAHFLQSIKDLYPTTTLVNTSETGELSITELSIDGKSMTLYSNLKDKTLTLLNADKLKVKEIGEWFDKELAAGKFQECFGRICLQ